MKYIKHILLFIESITNTKYLLNWDISYNHSRDHDLDEKIKRTDIKDFNILLNNIILKSEEMLLNGSYTFVSFKYKCKIVSYINNSNKKILIVTFLGENQYIKNNDKIIII